MNQLIFFIFIVNVLFWLFFIFFRKNRIIRSFVKNLNSHFLDDICDCVLIVNQKGRILKKNRQAKLFFTQFIDEDPKYTEKIFNNYHFYKNYKNKRFTLKDSSKEILLTQEPLFFLGKREYKIIFFKNTEKVFDNQILLLENEDRIKDFLQDAFFSEESFKAVFDEAAIAIAMTDLEGKIILANQSFASILQEKRHELQFKNFKDFVFSGDRLIDENFYKELLSGKKKTYQIEKRLVNHSGKIVWCHITYSLIFNLKNQPESIILMIEDATQKKENEVLLWENEKLYRSLFQNLFYGVAYLEILKDEFKKSPIFDVVSSVLNGLDDYKGKIGIIGTRALVRSGVYLKFKNIVQKACPLFVSFIEEGEIKGDLIDRLAEKYLRKIKVEKLVLACTHYPIIERIIQRQVGKKAQLINPGVALANDLKKHLEKENFLNGSKSNGKREFFVTDLNDRFIQVAEMFLGEKLDGRIEKVSIDKI